MKQDQSKKLFKRALDLFPGGVNSPVRAFTSVGGDPVFIDHGEGAYLIDADGNRYIDYVLSWGPLILGHAHPRVVKALGDAIALGTTFGAPSRLENELADLIQSFMPGIEMLRFVNSGTEATMSALRLARAFTERKKIIKFEGAYHGHADLLLVDAGSGVATLGLPNSPGVPEEAVADTLVVPYNNLDAVEKTFQTFAGDIAAVIVEPVSGNMGMVPPVDGFLEGLRRVTTDHGALLVFDEVMTGFRVHAGGAQALYNIEPDLTTLGKVVGGGLPVGVYGGRRSIMEKIAPAGPVYQAGTLSGNPLAMAAGIATLRELKSPRVWKHFETIGERLVTGLTHAAADANVPVVCSRLGSMFGMFFSDRPVTDWAGASAADTKRFTRYFRSMLSRGIYLAPSPFEAGFLSTAHGATEVDITLEAAEAAFADIAG